MLNTFWHNACKRGHVNLIISQNLADGMNQNSETIPIPVHGP